MRTAGVVALTRVAATSRPARADDDLHVAPCRPTVSCTADLAPPDADVGLNAWQVEGSVAGLAGISLAPVRLWDGR